MKHAVILVKNLSYRHISLTGSVKHQVILRRLSLGFMREKRVANQKKQ